MKRLVGLLGLICGFVAGFAVVLNNPLSPPAYSQLEVPSTYQWKPLEFFGISFTPAELLGLSNGSVKRSLGAEEVSLASASIVLMQDASGTPVALATRLTAMNRSPDMLAENVGVDTYTNIFWPNAGSILMHGYENRWPLIRDTVVAFDNDSGLGPSGKEFAVTAVPPDQSPTGVLGGSGIFSAAGGRYAESIIRDTEQPDLYAGTLALEVTIN